MMNDSGWLFGIFKKFGNSTVSVYISYVESPDIDLNREQYNNDILTQIAASNAKLARDGIVRNTRGNT